MSPRNFDFPDVRMDYNDYEMQNYSSKSSGTPPSAIHRSYNKSPTGRNYYDKSPQYEQQPSNPSAPAAAQTSRSPRGSRSLEYGAVSPKQQKKFEYYQPSSPDNDDEDSSYADYRHSVMYYGKKKKPYNKSPNGVSSLDDYNSCSAGYGPRNSIVTESSGGSDFSNATTARCGSSSTEPEERGSSRRRRHAINITNNPAYQVRCLLLSLLFFQSFFIQLFHIFQAIHNSHTTLDRTCSDSVVSLRCRKSTSDLTEISEAHTPVQPLQRRRGSSKVGLNLS